MWSVTEAGNPTSDNLADNVTVLPVFLPLLVYEVVWLD